MFSYSSGKIKVALYSKLTSSCSFCIKYNSDVRYFFNSLIMCGKIRCDADVDIVAIQSNLYIQIWWFDCEEILGFLEKNPSNCHILLDDIALIPSTRCVNVIPAVKN